MRSFFAASVLAAFCAPFAWAETYSTGSLAAELRRLQQQVNDKHSVSLPATWQVESSGEKYSISTQPVRALLDAKGWGGAANWLGHLASELERSTAAPAADAPGTRVKLDRILARREFQGVGPPSALQLLWQRFVAWVEELINRIFNVLNRHPTSSQILFWTLVAAAAGMLLLWLVRLGDRDRTILTLRGPHQPIAARPWAEWMAAARLAADQGDLRQAMHCAYWAGVARLQETGVLSADLTYTPREYLGLASASDAAPVAPLAALTTGLERHWYAGRAATADDFRESMKNLEALGCKAASGPSRLKAQS
jgi:hypothetical protein